MVFPSGMRDRTAPRGFRWIWFIRFAQLLITAIVLVLAAVDANSWSSCSVPGKVAWHLACAVISLLVLVYFILATGPSPRFKTLPWLVWGQLGLDAIMLIFWLAAAGASRLTCNDYCDACFDASTVEWNNLLCYCFGNDPNGITDGSDISKRDISPAPPGLRGLLEPRRSHGGSSHGDSGGTHGTVAARTAMDAFMVTLFAITLAATIRWIFLQRRTHSTAAPDAAPAPGQPESGNAGFPMTPAQQPATGYSPHPGEQYPQGPLQPQQPQPMYQNPNPQGPYPSQPPPPPVAYQTGAPAQY